MKSAQLTLYDIIGIFRRRKKLLVLPTLLTTILCGVGAFILPNKYESSTTILVQRDEILNPLISYEMAVTLASEDRLKTFNEIIYSRTTIEQLIDSLGIRPPHATEAQRQALVDAVQRNVSTERRGSDSFSISYIDTDPVRAQRAASLLTSFFIETTLRVEGQRNEQVVQFFEKKLEDLREKFEESQKQLVSTLGQSVNAMPEQTRAQYTQLESLEKQINDIDARISACRQARTALRYASDSLHSESGRQSLYDVSRMDVPFAADLKGLLSKYDDQLRRYTPRYPEVQKLEAQITDFLDRMSTASESEIEKLQPTRLELERRRADIVASIKQSSITQRVDEDKESDYGIYRKLYDEMKVKLEQAVTTRDLGRKGANQFIVIDPPLVPTQPSKPNRTNLILGGMGLGLFLGFLAVILRELIDTTVRVPRDVEVYQKPIIAFITDGEREGRN